MNYTVIDLGDGKFDLRLEPTIMRFASLEQANAFMKKVSNLASSGSSELTVESEEI